MRKSKSTDPNLTEEEKKFEQSLRPLSLKDFVGQQKITDNLNVFISAAKKRAGRVMAKPPNPSATGRMLWPRRAIPSRLSALSSLRT